MQDENAIEAQHSPRPIKTKPEVAAEGMPPQKTQKITHVATAQLLEITPLNPITNLPRAHSRTHPLPTGKGKLSLERNPLVKSQIPVSSDKPNQAIQTRLEFQSLQKHQHQILEKQDAPSERDLTTVRALESTLEELKQTVEQLTRQAEQEEAKLSKARATFKKEEEQLFERISEAKQELKEEKEQIADQLSEIENHRLRVAKLKDDIELKEIEIDAWKETLMEFQQEAELDLGSDDKELVKLEDDAATWKLMAEHAGTELDEAQRKIDEAGHTIDFTTAAELKKELKDKDSIIQELQNDLDMENVNLEGLGFSIEQELLTLKSRYNVTKGGKLEEEIIKSERELKIKYESSLSFLKSQHQAQMKLVTENTRSLEMKARTLKREIKAIQKALDSSERNFDAAAWERKQVQSRSEALQHEIEDIRRQLGRL